MAQISQMCAWQILLLYLPGYSECPNHRYNLLTKLLPPICNHHLAQIIVEKFLLVVFCCVALCDLSCMLLQLGKGLAGWEEGPCYEVGYCAACGNGV